MGLKERQDQPQQAERMLSLQRLRVSHGLNYGINSPYFHLDFLTINESTRQQQTYSPRQMMKPVVTTRATYLNTINIFFPLLLCKIKMHFSFYLYCVSLFF